MIDYTEYLFSDPTGILIPAPSTIIKRWAVVRPFRMRVNTSNFLIFIEFISSLMSLVLYLLMCLVFFFYSGVGGHFDSACFTSFYNMDV